MRREQLKNRMEEEHREKLKQAPELDAQEDVSFQGSHATLKYIAFFIAFCTCWYKGHYYMTATLERRKAQSEGRLVQYEQALYDRDSKSLKTRIFGKMGQEAPVKLQFGGTWQLKDLNGKPFGSAQLSGKYYLVYFGSYLCPDICPFALMNMQKAQRIISQSSEGQQFIQLQTVFVTTNPNYDTVERLRQFRRDLFGPSLQVLRAETNTASSLLDMLKLFKVPVGLSDEENEHFKEYYSQNKPWFFSKKEDDSILNDHSKVMYLMSPDNQFMSFYRPDLTAEELAGQLMEEISYDIGIRNLGKIKQGEQK